MKLKLLSKRIPLVVIITGLALLLVFLFYLISLSLISNGFEPFVKNAVALVKQKPINSQLPIGLKIPKININIALESVGLTSEGAVGVPKNPANAAWFNQGPLPGENGSAVISGHYGFWKNGELGVFNNLKKLSKGDKLYIKSNNGTITTFVVREFKTYGQAENVPAVFLSSDNKSHLNLITCGGVWDKVSKSYPERLVVFADKE